MKEIRMFREDKLLQIRASKIFEVINFRENSQNPRKPEKVLIAKISNPKAVTLCISIRKSSYVSHKT